VKIRRADISDLDQIRRLYKETITAVNKKDYDEKQISVWASASQDIAKWTSKINEQYFFVAEEENKIVGFGSVTKEGYLDYLYTHKDFQGQGMATELLKVIEKKAKELNLKEIYAHVSITARPFFESKGFAVTKTYITKVNGVEFEDCVLRKKIVSDLPSLRVSPP